MAFDLKEIVAARLGENYQLHERHVNPTLVAAQRVIGFDKVYARAEGAYLYDMDNQPYLDFLSGYSVFNIGRNHPVVKQAIRDVLDLDLPNMVQMDCSLLSGLLAEALTKRTPPHLDAVFFCNSGTEAMEGALKFARAATGRKRVVSLGERVSWAESRFALADGLRKFYGRVRAAHGRFRCTRVALDDIEALDRQLSFARCRRVRHRDRAGKGLQIAEDRFLCSRAGALPQIRNALDLR